MRIYTILTHQTQGFTLGPVKKGFIKELARHARQMDTCNYTYKWQGRWFIRDLLTGKKLLFSVKRQIN